MADPMKYDEWASEAMLSLPQYNLNSVTILFDLETTDRLTKIPRLVGYLQ